MGKYGIAAAIALLCAGSAIGQPPVDPDFVKLIAIFEESLGMKRYGDTVVREVLNSGAETVPIEIDSTRDTVMAVVEGPHATGVTVRAYRVDGREIARTSGIENMPLLRIPAGSGDTIILTIYIGCMRDGCDYAIQPLVPQAQPLKAARVN